MLERMQQSELKKKMMAEENAIKDRVEENAYLARQRRGSEYDSDGRVTPDDPTYGLQGEDLLNYHMR